MQTRRNLAVLLPAAVFLLCLAGSLLTRGAMANLQFLRNRPGTSASDLVDQQPLETAEALLPLAVSAEEQAYAHEAFRVADHEVDQAFAMALRQASAETRSVTGKTFEAAQKVTALQQTVEQDQAGVDTLTAKGKAPTPGATGDELDLAKTQLSLDTDELTDAQNNLAVVSGDQRGKIQQELATHEAGMKKYDNATEAGQVAVLSARRYGTLAGRLKAWIDQRSRLALLQQARFQADADAASLATQRTTLQQKASTAPASAQPDSPTPPGTRLAQLRRLEAQRNILGILDDRIEGQKELSANYGKWLGQVELQHRIVIHLLLNSLAAIAFIVLAAVAAASLITTLLTRQALHRTEDADRRRLHTLRTILHLLVQAVALLLILLVIFGPPSQVPTILGLATAGLTVVFQDFILAFFGWFVLMGKNGIRVGDWVEIDGVGGEVVEIGLFRTALLESGNWTDKGHPTGRRITFVNKFAVNGQYFNFSTTGQWMWDEIKVNIPTADNTYQIIEQIHQTVLAGTAADTAQAEAEWQRATQQHGMSQFSATPSVDLRPAAAGIDIVVRYVTRAGARFELRNRLYQAVIGLLHTPAPSLEPSASK